MADKRLSRRGNGLQFFWGGACMCIKTAIREILATPPARLVAGRRPLQSVHANSQCQYSSTESLSFRRAVVGVVAEMLAIFATTGVVVELTH